MKTISLAWASTLAMVAGIGIVAGIGFAAPKEPEDTAFRYKDGADVYANSCHFCHDTKIGPTIKGRGLDPLYIGYIVRHGNAAMPAFRISEINDQELEMLVDYVSKQDAEK